jgi:putative ABC transport system permease protein
MHYYVPFSQWLPAPPTMISWPRANGLLVRQDPAVDTPADAIRRAVVAGSGDLPFLEVRPYATFQGPRLAHWLMGTRLLLLFGALALATAAVGIHAAFAHAVVERRHEIAVRLAVGASRQRIRLMMLREGTAVAGRGLLYGVVVAVLAGWVLRSMLVGLSSAGPLVIGLAGTLVLIVAILATWFPARTASRADPNALLRAE